MEVKPFRVSAVALAAMGTGVVLSLVGVHIVAPLPEAVLAVGIVGYIMLLGQCAMKLCEDAPPGESDEVQIKRLELEHERLITGPPSVVVVKRTGVEGNVI